MSEVKMFSEPVPNVPWQDRPANDNHDAPIWRYTENPIIGRNPAKGVARIFNSAVMPFEDGFIGVFRGEQTNGIPFIYLGHSKDGIHWEFEPEKIAFVDEAGNPFMPKYAYDPRLVKVEDTYYIIWCQDAYGAAIGMAKTTDFKTFVRVENPFLPFNRNAVLFPRKVDGKFLMLSRPSDSGHTPFGDIFLSESKDLEYWGHHRHVMGKSGRWWENVKIGGGAKVSVQSMLNIPSTDIEGSVRQAKQLEAAGCEIIRAAIPNKDAVQLIPALKEAVSVPIVADIHFDYRLALEACAAGVDKIRINPGNIGSDDRVKAVADACKQRGIPIRIGVNSGSLEKEILAKYGHPTPEALCDSALYHASLLEKFDFNDIVLSMKSSTVSTMIKAYELAAERCDYPLHLGVTEAGTERMGIIKSSAGIGALLLHGIGDTIRVSLTADPVKEVYAAHDILRALDIEKDGVQFVSCPTCGRTRIDLVKIANEVEDKLRNCKKNIKVAVMGCVVNGPGEAREADIGIAGGEGCGLVFKKGEIIRKVPEEKLVDALMEEVEKL